MKKVLSGTVKLKPLEIVIEILIIYCFATMMVMTDSDKHHPGCKNHLINGFWEKEYLPCLSVSTYKLLTNNKRGKW